MGFIQSNHSVILYNNTVCDFNMLEAARHNGVKRFFYASSACIYPEHKQVILLSLLLFSSPLVSSSILHAFLSSSLVPCFLSCP